MNNLIGKVTQGDCLEVMLDIEDKSIDAIISDPPYGTTAVACERLGRRWIGIEKEEKYCTIARDRIAKEQNQLKLNLT